MDRQLQKETRRRAKAEKLLQSSQSEIRIMKEKMNERDRQLSVLNIYAQRNKKTSRYFLINIIRWIIQFLYFGVIFVW